jgi:hypothetical protein
MHLDLSKEEDVATACFVTNYLDDTIQIDEWVYGIC